MTVLTVNCRNIFHINSTLDHMQSKLKPIIIAIGKDLTGFMERNGSMQFILIYIAFIWMLILLTEVRWGKSWSVLIPVNAVCERSGYWFFTKLIQIFLLQQ